MIDPDIMKSLTDWQLDTGTIERLSVYAAMVDRAPMNLTAFSSREFWLKGVLDALSLLPLLERDKPRDIVSAVDIGSGSGLPGMVLAIVRPHWGWTLVDSRHRRADFLQDVISRLALTNVSVVAERAEEWPRNDPTALEKFDVVTARAVAPVMTAVELTLPLAQVGGEVVIPLGEAGYRNLEENQVFVERLGGMLLPLSQPWVASIKKVRSSPRGYPRSGPKLGQLK